ncbi:hypothetical protein [Rhodococcus sp. 14-2496-1d]|nr:hypothetical protein [Rhodococcus sp. 14-2496-1d]
MADEPTLTPFVDEGQARSLLIPGGRRAYRYDGSDDLIIDKWAADV